VPDEDGKPLPSRASEILSALKRGQRGAVLYRRLGAGYLRLKYDGAGDLEEVTWSRRRTRSEGLTLYFDLVNQTVTCKTPLGLSGVMWVAGTAFTGTVYEGSGGKPRRIAVGDWIDECVERMMG
jgi:hypothetical protein